MVAVLSVPAATARRFAAGETTTGALGEATATPEDLQAQQRRLEELRRAVRDQTDDLKRAKAELAVAALEAATALERYTAAVRELQRTQLVESQERRALLQARLDLAENRRQLGQWARQAYQGGAVMTQHPGVVTLLTSSSTDDVAATMAWLRGVGRAKGRVIDAVEVSEQTQSRAVGRAEVAASAAEAAQVEAAMAKQQRDAAVDQQRATVRTLSSLVHGTREEAAEAAREEDRLREAVELARRQQTAGGAGGNRVTGEVGDCRGSGVEQYENGRIPLSVLCPLWAAGEHHLRADAAFAFDRLSKQYARHFGKVPCITDSYRSYQEQVDLYARKPSLAAVPGTSNHGWGTALDLCGGIQNFGSSQHEWMVQNGPLFGWFHPSWARQGGSRPEPWHFEYGG
jgi:hypothetical protein